MKNEWEDEAACIDWDTNLFFDTYEEDLELRPQIDEYCMDCPVMKQCFAVGVSNKTWGVRGGVYFENGKISREFNRHKSKADWANIWQRLTIEKES